MTNEEVEPAREKAYFLAVDAADKARDEAMALIDKTWYEAMATAYDAWDEAQEEDYGAWKAYEEAKAEADEERKKNYDEALALTRKAFGRVDGY